MTTLEHILSFHRFMKSLLALALVMSAACAQLVEDETGTVTSLASSVTPQSGTLLQLADGQVQGQSKGTTRSFVGIPYAAPPLGALRWKPPHSVEPWSTPRDATGPGVACIQTGESRIGRVAQSEDCLQLNVFAPAQLPKKPVPVMVWLHGGANSTGSANAVISGPPLLGSPPRATRLYDGAAFREYAEREVVVVTLNYRLGALGFLAHPGLTAEAGAAGNYGLMDQQAALRWVHRNIAAFGGDPDRITLFGQSAGATDICYQLLSKGASGLFHAAVLQSGSCGSVRVPELLEAELEGEAIAAELGCAAADPEASLSCLRQQSAEQIARATPVGDSANGELSARAVIDGLVLSEQPRRTLDAGRFQRVPMIIGSDAQGQPDAADGVCLSTCAAGRLATRVSSYAPVFVYDFARSAAFEPSLQGSLEVDIAGGSELLWIWNVWPVLSPYAAEDTSLSLQLRGYWSQLIDGDVNSLDEVRWARPQWPGFEGGHATELSVDLKLETREQQLAQRCQFWSPLLGE